MLQIRKRIPMPTILQQQQPQQGLPQYGNYGQMSPQSPLYQNDPFPGIDMTKATAIQAQQYFKSNPYLTQQFVSRNPQLAQAISHHDASLLQKHMKDIGEFQARIKRMVRLFFFFLYSHTNTFYYIFRMNCNTKCLLIHSMWLHNAKLKK